jgi:hypothetical protein
MKTFPIDFPGEWNCTVSGAIVASDSAADLSEDMIEVLLPNGFLVSAGWAPDSDPSGEYVVTVTSDMRQLIEPFKTTSVLEAIQEVRERVGAFYYRRTCNVSQSQVSDGIEFKYA